MRTIKELLIIVRDNIDLMKDKELVTALCSLIDVLKKKGIITPFEYNKLLDYLDNNKPANAIRRTKRTDFRNSKYTEELFWWKPCSITPRLKWLNEQINKL